LSSGVRGGRLVPAVAGLAGGYVVQATLVACGSSTSGWRSPFAAGCERERKRTDRRPRLRHRHDRGCAGLVIERAAAT
jgi:hypothetical protein